jgi:hypothetical protein
MAFGLTPEEGKSGLRAQTSAFSGARDSFAPNPLASGALKIDCHFPGGNIIVDSIKGDTVWLHQDLRDTEGNWFYWYFRGRRAGGRDLNFRFTRVDGNGVRNPAEPSGSVTWGWRDVIGVRGPAVSVDGGRTWRWLGTESVDGASFRFAFPLDAEDVRFAVAMPYVKSNLDSFLDHYHGNPNLRTDTLFRSRKGRPVQLLHLGRLDSQPTYRVLLTARHHACETMASYSLEGMMGAILADTEEGNWFRTHAEFLVVPFMDTDGVEDGDQGKNRRPHDHNRDYGSKSIYPEVRALEELVPRWSGGRVRFALDMHCPDLRGAEDQEISFPGGRNQQIWKQVEHFSRILESVQSGPLPFSSRNNMPFGTSWNKPDNQKPGDGEASSGWASELPGIWLAATIEIPYASAGGKPVTPDSAKALGFDLARALRGYLVSA